MKKLIEFIIFILYTIFIFMVKEYITILAIGIINLLLLLILKINIKDLFKTMLKYLIFIIITAGINMLIINVNYGVLIGIKLFLVCNTTYMFSRYYTYMDLANTIEKLFIWVKVIKIDPKDIGLMVCISIAFLPILQNEIKNLKTSLKSKNFKINIFNIHILLKPFFISILKKVDDIEMAIASKGYY